MLEYANCVGMDSSKDFLTDYQHKPTWSVGTKVEHQVISKDELDGSDLPMDEPKIEPEEIKDTPSKQQDVIQQDLVEEETANPQI